jgi:hypothetical protein
MFAYCVEKLDMEADEACEALLVAAVARRFPEIYEAIAEGDVDATSVCMIAPHISRTR